MSLLPWASAIFTRQQHLIILIIGDLISRGGIVSLPLLANEVNDLEHEEALQVGQCQLEPVVGLPERVEPARAYVFAVKYCQGYPVEADSKAFYAR